MFVDVVWAFFVQFPRTYRIVTLTWYDSLNDILLFGQGLSCPTSTVLQIPIEWCNATKFSLLSGTVVRVRKWEGKGTEGEWKGKWKR